MNLTELTELTDEALEAHAETVRQEQVRRQNLTQTPETIARLAQQYRDAGGDQAHLEAAATINALKDEYVNAGGDLAELD